LRTNKWKFFDPALGLGTILVTTLIMLFARWLASAALDLRASSKWLGVLLSLVATVLVGVGVVATIAQDQSRNTTPIWVDTPGGIVLLGAIFSVIITAIMMMPFMLMIIFMGRPTSRIFTPFNGRVRWQILRILTFLPTLALVSLLLFGGIMYGNIYFCMSAVFMGFGLLDAQAHWANHTHRKMEQTSGDITQS
jgi:membrane-associated HD superfamily phosphohydrolase